jgi:UDP-N-acetylmuramyl pentapeptide phosphotransferase/UDP-N-acetylglucosamine-1-phosphate transferase
MPASVIIPAYKAAPTIARTVSAARHIPGVAEVIVVDDGSDDGTAEAARSAGSDQVVVLPRNVGKGGALRAGLDSAHYGSLLFLDADLGESASRAGPLLRALEGGAGMAIAVFPKLASGGGLGLARGLAAAVIRLLGGAAVAAPLSGQRALSARLVRHVGIAPRFAVETALTTEAAHLNVPISELPLPLEHQPTGLTLFGFRHRAGQFWDILRFAVLAGHGLSWPALSPRQTAARLVAWLAALAGVIALTLLLTPAAAGLLIGVVAGGAILWLPSLWVSAVWLRLRKPNYLGRSLPAAAGLLFPVLGAPAALLSPLPGGARLAAATVIGVLGLVGLLDDVCAPRRQARGLGGHLRSLLGGRVTTGSVKALGGLAAGFAAAAILRPDRLAMIPVDGLLIALAANLVNLLDLRPGRALKGFGLICAVAVAVSPGSLALLVPMIALAAIAAPAECGGRVMLGDVGANVLGGIAGLGLALALSPWQKLIALAVLAAVHLLCERWSLTDLIARSRLLSALDRVGTSHLPPFSLGEERRA